MSKQTERRSKAVKSTFDRLMPTGEHGTYTDRTDPQPTSASRETSRRPRQLVRDVLVEAIEPSPDQPRKRFDEQRLQELADSIRDYGLQQPVTLKRLPDADKYRLIAGERRLRATKMAGLEVIPAVIKPDDHTREQEMFEQMAENDQRENLSVVERARQYQLIIETFELNQKQLADKVHKPRTFVVECLGVLRIPVDLLDQYTDVKDSHLIEASKYKDRETIEQKLQLAREGKATVQDLRQDRPDRQQREQVNQLRRRIPLSVPGFGDDPLDGTITLAIKDPPKLSEDELAGVYIEAGKQLTKHGRQIKKKAKRS